MRKPAEVKARKVTPPSPSYMNNDQFASYLSDLRSNRTARPGGARPHPTSTRPAASRASFSRHSLDTSSQAANLHDEQRAPSPAHAPSIGGGSVTSRYSGRSSYSRDYYPTQPTVPLKPSDVVPTATYMERGQRWMEKEEAFSLRDAMEEMDIRNEPPATEEELRIYNAALNEAAELVWEHQHGVPRPQPDGPYRYRPHLRKNSYAHARTASLTQKPEDATSSKVGRDAGSRSVSGSSSESDSYSRRNRLSLDRQRSGESVGDQKSYGSVGSTTSQFSGRRRSSMKRNISGEVERPFSGDQIWEEPEVSPANSPATIATAPYDRLGLKKPNPLNRGPLPHPLQEPVKPLERVEIYRNPPARSRDPLYTTNTGVAAPSREAEKEIRSQDIRDATSLRLKDRSSRLPEPTAVSDSPGRPIVSFNTNWKAPDQSTDVSPDRPAPTTTFCGRRESNRQRQPMAIPRIHLAEEDTPQSRPSGANIPMISVAGPDDDVPRIALPVINVPTIAVEEPAANARVPTITTTTVAENPKSRRPLPAPGATPGGRVSRTRQARSHWSPALGVSTRATTRCHECGFPIEGRFIALAGSQDRFHPQCFNCFTCGTGLEAMEISPEPEAIRNERVERIQRRANGEVLEEVPGMTEEEDGDERQRFFCHLDWHELYAPRCKHCTTPILGEHVVALGHHWHNGHFFCAECGDPFEHGMTHIEKDGYAWCINCQTKRTQRRAPKCKRCKTAVIGEYIEALGGEWHEQCLRCSHCSGGFDDGQIFPKELQGDVVVLCTACRAKELKL